MRVILSRGWQQATTHPLRAIHYLLVFQVALGLAIMALVVYSFINIGWWTHREAAFGFALSAGIGTILALPIQLTVGYVRPTEISWMRRSKTVAGTLLALSLFLIYAIADVAMLSKPGKDFRKSFDEPPYRTWIAAIGLIFVQIFISVYRAYRIVFYSSMPVETSQVEMDDHLTANNVSGARASSARTLSQAGIANGGSSQGSTRIRLVPAQIDSERAEQQDHTEDEAAGLSKTGQPPTRARAKQREPYRDGVDELQSSVKVPDVDGNTWSPLQ